MFRKLGRSKQALSADECIRLLTETLRGVLSVNGDDGYPYGLPINHYYCPEDGRIYFHSGRTGHKMDALRRSPKASFCVMDSGTREDGGWALTFKSVIVFGSVEMVEDTDTILRVARALSHKFTDDEAYIEDEIARAGARTAVFALEPEWVSGKWVREK